MGFHQFLVEGRFGEPFGQLTARKPRTQVHQVGEVRTWTQRVLLGHEPINFGFTFCLPNLLMHLF